MFTDTPLSSNPHVDCLYLDNTYCDPDCEFPTRSAAMDQIIGIIDSHRDYDVCVGLRGLGKEEILVTLAKHYQTWVVVSAKRYETIKLLDLPEVFSTDADAGFIRVVAQPQIGKKFMSEQNRRRPTIAILPTSLYVGLPGIPFINQADVFVVPYSDHSSYAELKTFVSRVTPKKIIPIVRGKSRGPFGISLSSRSDMSPFAGYLDPEPQLEYGIPDIVQRLLKQPNPVLLKTRDPVSRGLEPVVGMTGRKPLFRSKRSVTRGVTFTEADTHTDDGAGHCVTHTMTQSLVGDTDSEVTVITLSEEEDDFVEVPDINTDSAVDSPTGHVGQASDAECPVLSSVTREDQALGLGAHGPNNCTIVIEESSSEENTKFGAPSPKSCIVIEDSSGEESTDSEVITPSLSSNENLKDRPLSRPTRSTILSRNNDRRQKIRKKRKLSASSSEGVNKNEAGVKHLKLVKTSPTEKEEQNLCTTDTGTGTKFSEREDKECDIDRQTDCDGVNWEKSAIDTNTNVGGVRNPTDSSLVYGGDMHASSVLVPATDKSKTPDPSGSGFDMSGPVDSCVARGPSPLTNEDILPKMQGGDCNSNRTREDFMQWSSEECRMVQDRGLQPERLHDDPVLTLSQPTNTNNADHAPPGCEPGSDVAVLIRTPSQSNKTSAENYRSRDADHVIDRKQLVLKPRILPLKKSTSSNKYPTPASSESRKRNLSVKPVVSR